MCCHFKYLDTSAMEDTRAETKSWSRRDRLTVFKHYFVVAARSKQNQTPGGQIRHFHSRPTPRRAILSDRPLHFDLRVERNQQAVEVRISFCEERNVKSSCCGAFRHVNERPCLHEL